MRFNAQQKNENELAIQEDQSGCSESELSEKSVKTAIVKPQPKLIAPDVPK